MPMGYIFKNENPYGKMVDDCVIRAIATALGLTWDEVAYKLFIEQCNQKDLQNANTVWGQVLQNEGFIRRNLPCTNRSCYTIREFTLAHPKGIYVVGDGSHAVAVVDGYYIDSYDSGDRNVLFYYQK